MFKIFKQVYVHIKCAVLKNNTTDMTAGTEAVEE